MSNNTTKVSPMTRSTKPTKKRKPKGLTFPEIITPDTGIVVANDLNGPRYRLWYHKDGRRCYVYLPIGITIEDARARRDRLYLRLKANYGAKKRTPKPSEVEQREYTVSVGPDSYIYYRPPSWQVKIRGKLVGEVRVQGDRDEAQAKLEAQGKRDAWIAANQPGFLVGKEGA